MASVVGLTKTFTLPDGASAVIKKLSWSQLKKAAKAQSAEALESMRAMGAELVKALNDPTSKKSADETAEKIEELSKASQRKPSNYEMASVLFDGVVTIDGQEVDVNAQDPVAAEALHEAIVNFAWEVPGKNA